MDYQSNQHITKINSSILKTKLYAPPLREDIVMRAQLIERLGIFSGHKLTLISAPAGYGKTTLIIEWLKITQTCYAWVSLDKNDNDPIAFFAYLISSFMEIDKGLGQVAHSLLPSSQHNLLKPLIDILINDIINFKKTFVLVLDDYHSIHNKLIHDAIQYLLDYQPANIHIVLLTREDPPFQLSRLRSRGQVLELPAYELCFSNEETDEFLRRTMKLDISTEDVKLLNTHTEGWIAGLQLAALSLQGMEAERTKKFIHEFSGDRGYIWEYLAEEVLYKQNNEISLFLYHTSILDRFTATLCDSLMRIEDSKSIIDYLDKAKLFLVPLDDRGEWYRYHHLFSEFLRSGLGKAEKSSLHIRASQWLEENGYLQEAVQHSIAAEDLEEAERLMEAAALDTLFVRAEFSALLNWIDYLPEKRLRSNAVLLIYKAWCYFLLGKPERTLEYILENENNQVILEKQEHYGRLLTVKAAVYAMQGESEALQIAMKAVEYTGSEDEMFYLQALHALSNSYVLIGNIDEAVGIFRKTLTLALKNNFYSQHIAAAFFLASCLNKQGKRREAEELCVDIINRYKNVNMKIFPILVMYIPLGILYYDSYELIYAQKYLHDGIIICSRLNVLHFMGEGEWSLAMLQYTAGNVNCAFNTIKEAKKSAGEAKMTTALALLNATEAYILLREGNLKQAIEWVKKSKLKPVQKVQPIIEFQYFVYARILIAQNNLMDAEAILSQLESSQIEGKRYRSIIMTYILRSIIHKLQNNTIKAVEYLEKAITYAAPEGYYRYFVEEGQLLEDILPMVHGTAPGFVDELIMKLNSTLHASKLINQVNNYMPNLLSNRELEILHLISIGLSNEEISKKLYIATGTAKNYISNIYAKLGVKKRTEALIKARDIGLL